MSTGDDSFSCSAAHLWYVGHRFCLCEVRWTGRAAAKKTGVSKYTVMVRYWSSLSLYALTDVWSFILVSNVGKRSDDLSLAQDIKNPQNTSVAGKVGTNFVSLTVILLYLISPNEAYAHITFYSDIIPITLADKLFSDLLHKNIKGHYLTTH